MRALRIELVYFCTATCNAETSILAVSAYWQSTVCVAKHCVIHSFLFRFSLSLSASAAMIRASLRASISAARPLCRTAPHSTPHHASIYSSAPLRASFPPQRRPTYTRFGENQSSTGAGGNGNPQWQNWRFFRQFADPRTQMITVGLVGTGGAYYVYHLEKVQESGRWRFMDTSRETEKAVSLRIYLPIKPLTNILVLDG